MNRSAGMLIATSLTLFSMFFGAGNLIFPPMLGQAAGEHFWPAMLGFLLGGIGLPVLTIITMAMTGSDVRSLGKRAGSYFNMAFCVVAYLSVGAMYAIPRTGAVSYSAVLEPVVSEASVAASTSFYALFFAVALLLARNPEGIVAWLGRVLTPLLLVLLVTMVVLVLARFDSTAVPQARDPYVNAPATAGFVEGYLTMDSIAALAFGILVVQALRNSGRLVPRAIAVSVIAGAMLAAIYLGLGLIGLHYPGEFNDGAVLLADAAHATLGPYGQAVFGLTVLLACMTTAVGLLAATSEFFHRILPGIGYRTWLGIFTAISFGIASLGLSTMLAVAAPLISFIYPIVITLVSVTLFERVFKARVPESLWAFRLAAWTAALVSGAATLLGLIDATDSLTFLPLAAQGLGWVLPTIVAYVLGAAVDMRARAKV